jgi:hypothetical protein
MCIYLSLFLSSDKMGIDAKKGRKVAVVGQVKKLPSLLFMK